MKHLFAVLFALLIGGFAKAQTNAQLFYDFGSDRKFVTLTLEMFKAVTLISSSTMTLITMNPQQTVTSLLPAVAIWK